MNAKRQLLNTLLIIVGAALLLFSIITDTDNVYIKIIGLIILMFGLFTATRQWVDDNKSEDDDE